ncbi:MAG: GerMN domain-containing protein [Nitrospiraceae bacterium]|nr:GerMN domain-containing protein [Nitrospiraceae bacterium]
MGKSKRLKKRRSRSRTVFLPVLLFILAGGLAAGYLYLSGGYRIARPAAPEPQAQPEDSSYLKMYYPMGGFLQTEQRSVSPAIEDRRDAARDAINQYLAGPEGMTDPAIPSGAKLRRLYFGTNGVLYVDLSQEFKSNFHGDALTEYLLLKGFYESLISNVQGITDVMVLIDGRQIESIGGHILANRPLGELVPPNAAVSNAAIANTAGNGQ